MCTTLDSHALIVSGNALATNRKSKTESIMQIKAGTVVSIDYTLTEDEGAVIDQSQPGNPLTYLHGHRNIIPGLENALAGKQSGDDVTVSVSPAEGYGEHRPELLQEVPSDRFQGVENLQVGMQFQASTDHGPVAVRVTKVEGDVVTVDGNHPLAGKNLNFAVKVADVRAATEEELAHGHVHASGGCCGGGGDEHGEGGGCGC